MAQNPPVDTTNDDAKAITEAQAILIKTLVSEAEALAIAAYPWLGIPVVKQIWELAAGYYANLFSELVQVGTTFLVIDSQIANEKTGLKKELDNIIAVGKTGDPDAIKKAIKAYADAQSALVRYDGANPPK